MAVASGYSWNVPNHREDTASWATWQQWNGNPWGSSWDEGWKQSPWICSNWHQHRSDSEARHDFRPKEKEFVSQWSQEHWLANNGGTDAAELGVALLEQEVPEDKVDTGEEMRSDVGNGRIFTYCELQSQFVDSFDTIDIDKCYNDEHLPSFQMNPTGPSYTRQELLLAKVSCEGDPGTGVMLLSTPWPSESNTTWHSRSRDDSNFDRLDRAPRSLSRPSARQSTWNLDRASKPWNDELKTILWLGPLPLPHNREADEREIRSLLDGLRIYRVEMHRQYAYVTVPTPQSWEVRVRVMNRSIRHGPKLHARERIESCEWEPIQASPLEIAFSQAEIADRFRDECLLEESVAQTNEQSMAEGWSLLVPPFDPIRVVGDGHRYVTLDNQRLYVLQRRAVELWPRPCMVDLLLCQGQTPSEFWAKLGTRTSGDRVVVLSGIPSSNADDQRWSSVTKWSRAWCCEEAIAEAEMKSVYAEVEVRWCEQHLSDQGSKWRASSGHVKRYDADIQDRDNWWPNYRGSSLKWVAKPLKDASLDSAQANAVNMSEKITEECESSSVIPSSSTASATETLLQTPVKPSYSTIGDVVPEFLVTEPDLLGSVQPNEVTGDVKRILEAPTFEAFEISTPSPTRPNVEKSKTSDQDDVVAEGTADASENLVDISQGEEQISADVSPQVLVSSAPEELVATDDIVEAVELVNVEVASELVAAANLPLEGVGLEERRVEPESGKVYTLSELESAFASEFAIDEIHAYWRDACIAED